MGVGVVRRDLFNPSSPSNKLNCRFLLGSDMDPGCVSICLPEGVMTVAGPGREGPAEGVAGRPDAL